MLQLITRIAAPNLQNNALRTVIGARSVTNLSKVAYTAKGQASGQGRNGVAKLTSEGPFEVKLAMPKSLGGSGDGQNPEQLFAVNHIAGSDKIKLPGNVAVEAHVSIGTPSEGPKPFALTVDLVVTSDANGAEEKKKLQEVVEKAHEVCPYSNATVSALL